MNIIFYIALILVVLILILKFKKGKLCGPKCQLFQKPASPKKPKSYEERMEEIEKKIERQKNKSYKDLDLFGDFIDKKKKK